MFDGHGDPQWPFVNCLPSDGIIPRVKFDFVFIFGGLQITAKECVNNIRQSDVAFKAPQDGVRQDKEIPTRSSFPHKGQQILMLCLQKQVLAW